MLSYSMQTLTLKEFQKLIASADDSCDNQIRITKDGRIYISEEVVGAEDIEHLHSRYETYEAGNDYVGPNAAQDEAYVKRLYDEIKRNWDSGRKGYIDY